MDDLLESAKRERKRREWLFLGGALGGFALLFAAIWLAVEAHTEDVVSGGMKEDPASREPGAGSRKEEFGLLLSDQPVLGIALVGHYAYLAAGSEGLLVVDVRHPANPTEVARLDTAGKARSVVVESEVAYVADGHGLSIIDVAQPHHPKKLGVYDAPGKALGVRVQNGHAYLADGSALRIISLAKPEAPREIASVAGAVVDIAIAGPAAYLADEDRGLVLLFLSKA